MESIITINNLSYIYDREYVFKDLTLKIEESKFTTILGATGCGKTTLAKLLSGENKSNRIIIDGIHLTNYTLEYIKTFTSVIYEDTNNNQTNTVMEEILEHLKEIKLNNIDDKLISQITGLLGIKHLLKKKLKSLNAGQKQLVSLAKALAVNPKILVIDEGLNKLDEETKEKILIFLKDMTKLQKITVVYLTTNTNESLYGDNIIILSNKTAIAQNKKEKIFENEELFKMAKLQLPFIIDLSQKLQFYNLIDKNYINKEMLVEDLWK